MYRIPRLSLLALAVCTAALAACSDSATGPAERSRDPEVIAANRNLGGGMVVTSVKKSDKVIKGTTTKPAPSAASLPPDETFCMVDDPTCGTYCPVYSTSGTSSAAAYPYCPPPPPTDYPSFSVWTSISTWSSYGTKYVTLSATGDYWYASYGDMSVSYRNAGGCYSTPTEYTNAYHFSYNAPFTLSSSRSASYNGTISAVNWEVAAYGSAESPGGGWDTRFHSTRVCY